VFAGGDMTKGPATVVEAIAAGRKAAFRSIAMSGKKAGAGREPPPVVTWEEVMSFGAVISNVPRKAGRPGRHVRLVRGVRTLRK